MNVRITADSTCDLSPELVRKYGIGIAPLSVIIDGEVFHDGVDVTPRDIFRAVEAGKSVRTAAVNTYEYREFFSRQLEDCRAFTWWTAGICPPEPDCWCWKELKWLRREGTERKSRKP